MERWIQETLSANSFSLAALPALFLLGLLAAVGSCCTLPVIGAVVGYSGSVSTRPDRRELLFIGFSFMVGTVLSLTVLGAATGLVGHVAGASLGKHWRVAAGLVVVLFGLSSLGLAPLRVPRINFGGWVVGGGVTGAVVYGLAVGGGTTACSLACNPLLAMALSAAVLKGATVLGAALLAAFAFGYSLPLTAALVGVGFGLGRLGKAAGRVLPAIRIGTGVLLVGVGFYLLATP